MRKGKLQAGEGKGQDWAEGVIARWRARVGPSSAGGGLTNEEAGAAIGISGEAARLLRTGARSTAKPATLRAMALWLGEPLPDAVEAVRGADRGGGQSALREARRLADELTGLLDQAIREGSPTEESGGVSPPNAETLEAARQAARRTFPPAPQQRRRGGP